MVVTGAMSLSGVTLSLLVVPWHVYAEVQHNSNIVFDIMP